MRACYIQFLLIGWVSAVSAQTGSDALASRPPSTDGSSPELSDEQLQYFVTNVGDFLYRFGGHLDEFNYSLLEDLTSNALVWHEQAYARLKHEAVALCQRSESYGSLGVAEELNRIGEEFDSRYSDRIRTELSQLSDDAAPLVREYVWRSDFRAPLRPWKVILKVVREGPDQSPENLAKFVCEVANERL
jgi:hypothetical protein